MRTQIFINLPVAELPRSLAFFKALGYAHNPQFTDGTAACIAISEEIHVMALTHAKFREFTPERVNDHRKFAVWNPWAKMDPAAVNSYSGPDSGVAAKCSWVGKKNVFESREHRDKTNQKIMADPRMAEMYGATGALFDCKRMAYGGFRTIVEL